MCYVTDNNKHTLNLFKFAVLKRSYVICCKLGTYIDGLHVTGLHDHFNRGQPYIEAFFQPIFFLFFHFETILKAY